jgi:transcriptional regulator with XRE-family HTH domain
MEIRLRKLMEENHMTQAELAEVAGVSQAFISVVLKGYKVPSVAVLKRLADHFGVTIDELAQ